MPATHMRQTPAPYHTMSHTDPNQHSQKPTSHPAKSRGGFARIVNALRYSMEGLGASFRHEAAFRQEILMAAVLLPVALFLPTSLIAKALLIFSVLMVLVVELLNSALEWTVDYISQATHPFAKRAKDIASAAVFLSITAMVLVWLLVLCDIFL